jgi:hypothetical protein
MIEQLIKEGVAEVAEVKRWIDNDIEAGDEAIRIHADALARAEEKFDQAMDIARQLEPRTSA